MSVLIETTHGDLVVDLDTDRAPKACLNFIKLCSRKYYNFAPFWNLVKASGVDGAGSYIQSGDPEGPSGDGGRSCWALAGDDTRRYFHPEVDKRRRHMRGTLSMACTPAARRQDEGLSEAEREEAIMASLLCGSQFFLCLSECPSFDGLHCPIGTVAEDEGVLDSILKEPVDDGPHRRPLQDIRILHTIVLHDPYDDPPGMPRRPSRSPDPSTRQLAAIKLSRRRDEGQSHIDGLDGDDTGDYEQEGARRRREADTSALTLETLGDLPFASIRPPENVLFVCKLNPATRADDLGILFGRFGRIETTHLCRDSRTNDSLGYAFIEYDRKQDAEQAYAKMQGCLVDDRRIHVDFSQSVSRYRYDTSARRAGPSDARGLIDKRHYDRRYDRSDETRRQSRTSHHDDHHRRADMYEHRRSDRRSGDRRPDEYRSRRDSRSPDDKHRHERRSHRDRSRERSRRHDRSRSTDRRRSSRYD